MIDRRLTVMGSVLASMTAALGVPDRVMAQPQAGLRVRRRVQQIGPTDRFWQDYATAIDAMRRLNPPTPSPTDTPFSIPPTSFRAQSLVHLFFCPHSGAPPYPSTALQFVSWHRFYIWYFEALCANLSGNPQFTLPYFDWSFGPSNSLPLPFYSTRPAPTASLNVVANQDVSNDQNQNWGPAPVTSTPTRALQPGSGILASKYALNFRASTLNSILTESDFTRFTSRLEKEPHNHFHLLVGNGPDPVTGATSDGHMGDGMSPLDPIFWLHHCMVDRMWARWQQTFTTPPMPDGNPQNQFLNQFTRPDQTRVPRRTANEAADFAALGYTYDDIPSPRPPSAPPPRPQGNILFGARAQASRPAAVILATQATGARLTIGQSATARLQAPRLATALTARQPAPLLGPRGTVLTVQAARSIELVIKGAMAMNLPTGTYLDVYVNAPDGAGPDPLSSEHLVGSEAFFSRHSRGIGEHAGHGTTDIRINITEGLGELAAGGRIEGTQLQVLLRLYRAGEPVAANAQFSYQSLELVAV